LEDRLLMTLEYLREYRTYFHLGQSYGLSESACYRSCRLKWLAKTGQKIGKNKLCFAPINKKIEGKKWRTKNAVQNSKPRWP